MIKWKKKYIIHSHLQNKFGLFFFPNLRDSSFFKFITLTSSTLIDIKIHRICLVIEFGQKLLAGTAVQDSRFHSKFSSNIFWFNNKLLSPRLGVLHMKMKVHAKIGELWSTWIFSIITILLVIVSLILHTFWNKLRLKFKQKKGVKMESLDKKNSDW